MGLKSFATEKKVKREKPNRFGKHAFHRILRRAARREIEEQLSISVPNAAELEDMDAEARATEDYLEQYWSTDDWDEAEFLALIRRR